MAAKKQEKQGQKPKEKMYTYEEYRKAFCNNPEPELEIADPQAFGMQLAKEVLKKIGQDSPKK